MSEFQGGCLCGAIRYVASGAPVSTNLCFCKQCQRQSGAVAPAFATFSNAQFRVLAGDPATYRSSPKATREFCAQCGSSLFWREERAGEVDVFLGTFDEPGRLPPPEFAIWTKHRVPWLPDLDGVRSYEEQRSDEP